MKLTYVITFFLWWSSVAACDNAAVIDDKRRDATGLSAEIFEDTSICDIGTPILLKMPKKFHQSEFRSAYFTFNMGEIYVATNLSYSDVIGGAYLCLDKNHLNFTRILVSYGIDSCKGSKHTFIFDELDDLLREELVYPRYRK